MAKVKTYIHTSKNMTALIGDQLKVQWEDACERTGLSNADAFKLGLTLVYADPSLWVDVFTPGTKPETANFHVRLTGVYGTFIDTMVQGMKTKRLTRNDLTPVSQTTIIELIMINFVERARDGSLMSISVYARK